MLKFQQEKTQIPKIYQEVHFTQKVTSIFCLFCSVIRFPVKYTLHWVSQHSPFSINVYRGFLRAATLQSLSAEVIINIDHLATVQFSECDKEFLKSRSGHKIPQIPI